MSAIFEVLLVFFRLGLTSFGGPVAHLGYFHGEFVKKREWIHEHAYADLVALCQFLPGPASSQVGMSLGLYRGGMLGAIAAWIGFTLPSAVILVLFALGMTKFASQFNPSWLHGLKIAAVVVVAQAVWAMAVKLCPDKERASIALVAAIFVAASSSALGQVLVLFAAGLVGLIFLRKDQVLPHVPVTIKLNRFVGALMLVVFFVLLIVLPMLAKATGNQAVQMFDSFFRAGSLVFGGGHVVLPLLQAEVVPHGWVSNESFMAGYGAAQAVPGPLFSFSAYLGAVTQSSPTGWVGAAICLVAAFFPSYLLVVGVLPFWEQLRTQKNLRYAMSGINAGVVGLLISAMYHPVWTSAIFSKTDFSIALGAFLLLTVWKLPSWAVVVACGFVAQMV